MTNQIREKDKVVVLRRNLTGNASVCWCGSVRATDHPEIKNCVFGHETIGKFVEVIPMELMEDILELGDESLFESDYAEWFENTKIFVEKQYKHAIEMLRLKTV